MSTQNVERHRTLRSLLELDRPLESVLHDLAGFRWDSEAEGVTLLPKHLIEILNRFKDGLLNAEEAEKWADAIEGREDVAFDQNSRTLLKEAIFDLANPVLQGVLTTEIADEWIERLRRYET